MIKGSKLKIGIISFGVGGTKGHMTLVTSVASILKKFGAKAVVYSEDNYADYASDISKDIRFESITKQEHTKTVAGKLEYLFRDELLERIKKEGITHIIFSTFFDEELIKEAKKAGILSILVSYPLRDSHREAFLARKYYRLFHKVITLKDVYDTQKTYPNEIFVRPPHVTLNFDKVRNTDEQITKILVSPGGGGRPSAATFFSIIEKIINHFKENEKIQFIIINGAATVQFHSKNVIILNWSNEFTSLINEADFVISEGGYFTIMELLESKKPSIIIPGARRIDNQKLRGMCYESNGCGYCFLPEESEEKIFAGIINLLNPANNERMIKNNKILFEKIMNTSDIDTVLNEVLQ